MIMQLYRKDLTAVFSLQIERTLTIENDARSADDASIMGRRRFRSRGGTTGHVGEVNSRSKGSVRIVRARGRACGTWGKSIPSRGKRADCSCTGQ